MINISVISPCERDRLDLFNNSIDAYNIYGIPESIEFIIPTRTIQTIYEIPFSIRDKSRLISYEGGGPYFNPAKALNLGVLASKYNNVIITCPEVSPLTNVFYQLMSSQHNNYVCQVFDLNQDGSIRISLVNKNFRGDTPGFYFLAMYRKEDIVAINGWDESFCEGKAYEDEDFGKRWVRANIQFEVREDIQANHQWHPRNDVLSGLEINKKIIDRHDACGLIKAEKGLNLYE